jgi:hypothetical protein
MTGTTGGDQLESVRATRRTLVVGGPEIVGAILAAGVIIGIATMTGVVGGSATSDDTPTGTPAGSARAVASTAVATPVSFAAVARTELAIESRVIDLRTELDKLVAKKSNGGAEISPVVRAITSTLTTNVTRIESLETAGAPAKTVAAIRSVQDDALASGLKTLSLSVRDDRGYRSGAKELVAILEPLDDLSAELADAAGLPAP